MEAIVIIWIFGGWLFAFIPAAIANGKGRSFRNWYIYGFFFGIIALIHSLVIARDPYVKGDMKKCPACAEPIRAEAVKCRYCGTDFSAAQPVLTLDESAEYDVHK